MREIRFGTDGVRGRFGEWPLTEEGARTIGRAVGLWSNSGRVVVGRDTRLSSPTLSEAMCRGLIDGGATVLDGGILPTAAVSCAVVDVKADAGVMITASHNPWADNGMKVLNAAGRKPSSAEIQELEGLFGASTHPAHPGRQAVFQDPAFAWRRMMPDLDLDGVTILLDCANGAAAPHAPGVLESMGATVIKRGCHPNGRNINAGVGALHPPDDLDGSDLAICLDGDADRVTMVVPRWGVLDGDDLLWVLSQGIDGPVVGTVMTNGGLEQALDGRLLRAAVGDRHVAARMVSSGARVGAEPSGHILFSDGMPTGDGLYAALRVLQTRGPLPRVLLPLSGWQRLPTVHRNVSFFGPRRPLGELKAPQQAQAAGMRVIIRYSGTEPLLRVLVEGTAAETWADRIVAEFRQS